MEQIELSAVDYIQVGVTGRKCMKLLPNTTKNKDTQSVVIGDKNGVLQSFSMKKKELTPIFKLNPGSPINQIDLGGALGTPQDKIFVASEADVRGYSKKGKVFLEFNSNMTEPISNLYISGSDLCVTGLYICNHFTDCVEKGFYLSPDKINDLICLPTDRTEEDELVPILACNDRNLRILKDSQLSSEVEVPGVPQCIVPFKSDDASSNHRELVYGTSDGKIGHVMLGSEQPEYRWSIANSENLGGVTCLSHHDMTGDGVEDLLVGREDGLVEVYSYNMADEPVKRFSRPFNESITSIQGGSVGTIEYDEIVVSTYSGWVAGLTTEQQKVKIMRTAAEADEKMSQEEVAMKLADLRAEVETLQLKVNAEKEKAANPSAKPSPGTVIRAATFHVNDSFKLSPTDASYHLIIEVETAIEYVVIQTDVPVDLLDVEKTSAVVSRVTQDPNDTVKNNYLLVTYRCQANTPRLEIKFRSIEGHHGHIQAYIVPKLNPKSGVLKRYPVCPLSLHQRTHSIDEKRPMNVLKLTGPFSIAEIHSWICFCLPDLPIRPPADHEAKLQFTNSFLDTQLECTYKKGEGVFKSDNISTVSILKDMLSKEATEKKIALNIHYEIDDHSVPHTLKLLHPKMDYQFLLVKKVNLLDALQELQTHEGNMEFLAPEYQQILEKAEELKSEFQKQPSRLERLYGMITDLYIDKFKFKGVNVKNRVPQLLEILDSYELATLQSFFSAPAY